MQARPVILVVEPSTALGALLEVLARRFGADYEIVGQSSAEGAVAALALLQERHADVALVIAAEQLGDSSGSDLLARSHEMHPRAKRALLVPWWDRHSAPAILRGCALGKIDNYLHAPWDPAEVNLFPVINEFLAEWTRDVRPGLELVRLVDRRGARRMHELDELLTRNAIPHGCHDVDEDDGRQLLAQAGTDGTRLPIALLLDGTTLVDPSNRDLADALGASTRHDRECELLIVGAGPAGLAAAVYAASEGIRTLVLEREAIGGQAGTSSLIRNYLGFPRGITGADLARRSYEQAWLFGAKYVLAREATGLRAEGLDRFVTLSDGREIRARAVLIATGARYRRLGIPSLERFVGQGVYYTALGDPFLFADQELFVAGGGNSAGQAAVHYAQGARKVTLLVRGASLEEGMSDYLVREIRRLSNVEVRLRAEVVEGEGDGVLEQISIRDRTTGTTTVAPTRLLFVLIGALPHTDWLEGTVARDDHGFIVTGAELPPDATSRPALRFETSLPGVFAIGDVRTGSVKRVASAVGEGSVAIHYVHEYLRDPVTIAAEAELVGPAVPAWTDRMTAPPDAGEGVPAH